jgi:hypothetical protein
MIKTKLETKENDIVTDFNSLCSNVCMESRFNIITSIVRKDENRMVEFAKFYVIGLLCTMANGCVAAHGEAYEINYGWKTDKYNISDEL